MTCDHLDQGWSTYSSWVKLSELLVLYELWVSTKVLLEHSHASSLSLFSKTNFILWQQSGVVATETVFPAKSKLFTLWLFTKKKNTPKTNQKKLLTPGLGSMRFSFWLQHSLLGRHWASAILLGSAPHSSYWHTSHMEMGNPKEKNGRLWINLLNVWILTVSWLYNFCTYGICILSFFLSSSCL